MDGLILLAEKGQNRGIYHVGSDVETSIADLAQQIGRCFDREVRTVLGDSPAGGDVAAAVQT